VPVRACRMQPIRWNLGAGYPCLPPVRQSCQREG
jgi:hypothetical protein